MRSASSQHRGSGADAGVGGQVLVLNATYEPINVCTVRRAAVLLLKERAELIEDRAGTTLHSATEAMPRPCGTLDADTWTVVSDPDHVQDTVIGQFDLSG